MTNYFLESVDGVLDGWKESIGEWNPLMTRARQAAVPVSACLVHARDGHPDAYEHARRDLGPHVRYRLFIARIQAVFDNKVRDERWPPPINRTCSKQRLITR